MTRALLLLVLMGCSQRLPQTLPEPSPEPAPESPPPMVQVDDAVEDCSGGFTLPLGSGRARYTVPLSLNSLDADVTLSCGGATGGDGVIRIEPVGMVRARICIVQASQPVPVVYQWAPGACSTSPTLGFCALSETGWNGPLAEFLNCTDVTLDGPGVLYVKAKQTGHPVLVQVEALTDTAGVAVLETAGDDVSLEEPDWLATRSVQSVSSWSPDGGLWSAWPESLPTSAALLTHVPGGQRLLVTSHVSGQLWLLERDGGSTQQTLSTDRYASVQAQAVSRDGTSFAVVVDEAQAGERALYVGQLASVGTATRSRLGPRTSSTERVRFTSDGALVQVTSGGRVSMLRRDGGLVATWPGSEALVEGDDWFVDGRSRLTLLDGGVGRTLPSPGGDSTFVSVSPNTRCFALMSLVGNLSVSDDDGGVVTQSLPVMPRRLRWSSHGTFVLVGSETQVRVIDPGLPACRGR